MRPRRRRRIQRRRLTARAPRRQLGHRIRAHFGVPRRDRRVRRAVVAQRRRWRSRAAPVAHRRRQLEHLPGRQLRFARRRRHPEVRPPPRRGIDHLRARRRSRRTPAARHVRQHAPGSPHQTQHVDLAIRLQTQPPAPAARAQRSEHPRFAFRKRRRRQRPRGPRRKRQLHRASRRPRVVRARQPNLRRLPARVQQPNLAGLAPQQRFVAHPALRLHSRRAAQRRQRTRRRVHVRQHLDVRLARQLQPPVALARARAPRQTLLRVALLKVRRVELPRRFSCQRQLQPLVRAVRRVERIDPDLRRIRRTVHHPNQPATPLSVRRRRQQRHPVKASTRHAPGNTRQNARSVQQQVRRVSRSPIGRKRQAPPAIAVTERSRQSRRRSALQLRRRVAPRLPGPQLRGHRTSRPARVVHAPHAHRRGLAAGVRQPQHAPPRVAAGVEERQLDLPRHQRRVVQRRHKTFRPRVRPRLDVQLRRQLQAPVPLARSRPRQPRRRVPGLHRTRFELDRRSRIQRQTTRLHALTRVVHRNHPHLARSRRPALDPHEPRVTLRRRRRHVRNRVRLLRAPRARPTHRHRHPREHPQAANAGVGTVAHLQPAHSVLRSDALGRHHHTGAIDIRPMSISTANMELTTTNHSPSQCRHELRGCGLCDLVRQALFSIAFRHLTVPPGRAATHPRRASGLPPRFASSYFLDSHPPA